MEVSLAGELYTLTKINSIAKNLQQQIHDLCDDHLHPPQMVIDAQQHQMATMGQGTRNMTSPMDVRTHRDIPNTGPCANQELPPVAQSSGIVPRHHPLCPLLTNLHLKLSTTSYKMHRWMLNNGMATDTRSMRWMG